MTIEIRRVDAETLVPLRAKVLRQGMPVESARFDGDLEPGSLHLAAFASEEGGANEGKSLGPARRVVGVATFLARPYPNDPESRPGRQLRGMAVDDSLQGSGVGSKLLESALEILAPELRPSASGRAPVILWCKARATAVAFYRRNGWIVEGEPFDIPKFGPHVFMRWAGDGAANAA